MNSSPRAVLSPALSASRISSSSASLSDAVSTQRNRHMWRQACPALITSLLFSGSYIAGKYTTQAVDPLLATFIRHVAAALFLQLMVWKRSNTPNPNASRSGSIKSDTPVREDLINQASIGDWLCLFLVGTFGVVGHHFFFLSSLRHTAIASAAIISAFTPIITALLATLLIKEKLSFQNYSGGLLAVIGMVILLAKGNVANMLRVQFNYGDLMMIGAICCWASYSTLVRYLSERYSSLTISYWGVLFGMAQLLILLLSMPQSLEHTSISWPAIFGLLYMGVAVSGIGALLFTLSVRCVGPTKSNGIVYSSLPLWVAGLAWLFFSEPVPPWMFLSMGLVIVGLYHLLRSRRVGYWRTGYYSTRYYKGDHRSLSRASLFRKNP